MEVILKEDVANLGFRGEVVKVADGYARNFLLPRKLALQAVVEANIELAFTTARSGMLSRYHRLKLPRLMIERGQDPVAALNRK